MATQATDASGSSTAAKRDSDKELADLVPLAVDGSRRALQRIMRIIHPVSYTHLTLPTKRIV